MILIDATLFLELLHPVFSTLLILSTIGILLRFDLKQGADDSKFDFIGIISVCLLPWIYVFIRKEGMTSWTAHYSSKYGLIITQYEIDEVICEKLEAEQVLLKRKGSKLKRRRLPRRKEELRKKAKLRELLTIHIFVMSLTLP